MKKIKTFFLNVTSNVWFGFKTSYSASKKYFLLKCLVLLTTTFIPIYTIWLWREIINGIIVQAKSTVILYLAIYLALKLFAYIVARFDEYIRNRYSDELTFYIEKVMMDKTSRVDLAFFDYASMGDKVKNTRNNFHIMQDTTWIVFNIISALINIIATFIIVSFINVWIGLLTIVLLIPYMLYNKNHTEYMRQMEISQIRDNRKKDYYTSVFTDNNAQFELKLNNLGNYFIGKYKEVWSKLFKTQKHANICYTIKNAIILIFTFLSELLILVMSIINVLNNKIGLGDLEYNVAMVARLRDESNQLMSDINNLLINNKRLNELQEFIKMKPEYEKGGKKIPSNKPRIEFCHVSFSYPNSNLKVLNNCSFVIEPNEKVGLIGLNGSGKSTIVKLMFRFYDPQEGVIKLDNVDIKEYDIYAVRQVFGILFQDYVTYCLPLREIIGLSSFADRFNDEKLTKVSNISGLSNIIKDWPQGFDSVIGRYYADNGKDLSGGQWQLVGLARAYFKECEFMVLDEPSAALDPISEDRIFEQLFKLSEKKSAVIISHRLSNTTLADKILVIDDGAIVEEGTHQELIKLNGKYAYWFNLQASRYQ